MQLIVRRLYRHSTAAVLLALCFCAGAAGGDLRLYEKDPFDRITLNKANENAVLEVEPIAFPDRKLPENPRRTERIKVRLLDNPDKLYELQWSEIDKIELFEQMVLEAAVEEVESGRLESAFDYFAFLQERYPKVEGLNAAMQTYLYEEAKAAHRAGAFDRALAMLRELRESDPERPGLDKALGMATDKLVDGYVAGDDYYSARKLLDNLAAWYPEQTAVVKWRTQFKDKAGKLLADARTAEGRDDLAAAARSCREAIRIWPQLPEGKEFGRSIYKRYPWTTVGVMQKAFEHRPQRIADWASRRSGRLLYRTLAELCGAGGEGGRYECPVGQIDVDPVKRRLSLQIRPDVRWSTGTEMLSAYDVSQLLLSLADPQHRAYRPAWAELLDAVAVEDPFRVNAQLRAEPVRPEALLQTRLTSYTSPASLKQTLPTNGPFVIESDAAEQTIYRANSQYFADEPGRPMEIGEMAFARSVDAIHALRQGRIQVLDRVNPWEVEKLRREESIAVEPYAFPLVHCLIPNPRRPFTANRTLRRAILYAIPREALLKKIVGESKLSGCRTLSGPFPRGVSIDDAIAYAYDSTIEPRRYDPRQAVALASVAVREVAAAQEKKGRTVEEMPTLVLAHPPDELSRSACKVIELQLKAVGIPVELKEFEGKIPQTIPDDVDLMYAQVAMWEPLYDARRLLGESGPAGECSSHMNLALTQLERETDYHEALRRIHRLAHDELTVVPLWQITDHFAYRKSLTGIGTRPVTLYQNVERWRTSLESFE